MLSVLCSSWNNHKFPLYLVVTLFCSLLAIANSQENLCEDQSDGALLPDPIHENWYYSCLNEEATLIICDEHLVFNLEEQRCIRGNLDELQIITTIEDFNTFTEATLDLSDATTVLPAQTLSSLPEALETDPVTAVPNTSTMVSILTSPTSIPTTTAMSSNLVEVSLCPCRDTYEPTYLSSYVLCDQYFMCYHGRPIEMSCCRGHHWSSVQKRCVPEYESLCVDVNSVVTVPDCPETGKVFYPHPYVCEYFYYCENGHQSIQQCDAFFHWDYYQQRCIIKTEAICITTLTKSNRRKYYI